MISLFIDSATSNTYLALLKDTKLIGKVDITSCNDLSTNVFMYLNKLFLDSNVDVNDIKKIFVSIGPGSFTGVRIGLTIAKVFAYTKNIAIIPLSSLEIMASTSSSNVIISLIDARRGFVYAGFYDNNLNQIKKDSYIKFEEVKNEVGEFVTDDLLELKSIKPNINIEKIISKHINDLSVDYHLIKPEYLKLTEAEESKID